MGRSLTRLPRRIGWVGLGVLLLLALSFSGSSPIDTIAAQTAPVSPPEARPTLHTSRLIDPEPLTRSVTLRETRVGGRILRYCSNASVDNPPAGLTRVIVALHGNDRQACGTATAALAAGTPEQRATTLVVTPWFPIRTDRINPNTDLHWSFFSWSQGDPAENVDARVSSYAVVDELLDRLRHVPTVVAGFSGGGQFVARYSAATSHEPVRFIIANPSSYLYWTADRPGTPPEQLAACPAYNDYRYGLNRLNPYLKTVGPLNLARRFGEREVVYLLGDEDNDPRSGSMDKSCGAQAEGPHRFERGMRYWHYLPLVFGPEIHRRHRLVVVPRVGHTVYPMFQHPGAKEALYG